jgi:hypothetical protein
MNKKSFSLIAIEALAVLTTSCSKTSLSEINPLVCDQLKQWRVEQTIDSGAKKITCEGKIGSDNKFKMKLADNVISAEATTTIPAGYSKVSGFFQNGDGSAFANSTNGQMQ